MIHTKDFLSGMVRLDFARLAETGFWFLRRALYWFHFTMFLFLLAMAFFHSLRYAPDKELQGG